MSNIEISKLQQLSSNEFLEHIKNDETIDDYFYNHLLVIHLLSILHNTTGVIEGGFNFAYQTEIDLKKDKAELLVELKNSFFVYNIKNQLIENTERCSRGNCNFKNNLFFLKNI